MGTLRRNQPTATLTATMLHNLAFLCVVGYASAGLVHYPNGAVVPVDPANQVATAAHLAAKAYASPYYHAGYHYLGKREADADADASLVHYPNGAVVPGDLSQRCRCPLQPVPARCWIPLCLWIPPWQKEEGGRGRPVCAVQRLQLWLSALCAAPCGSPQWCCGAPGACLCCEGPCRPSGHQVWSLSIIGPSKTKPSQTNLNFCHIKLCRVTE